MPPDALAWLQAVCAFASVVAVVAELGERHRRQRRDPDAVGFVPWRDVAFGAMLVGLCAGLLALRLWLAGG